MKKRTKTETKVPVTMRALVQRINRKLAKDDQQLRKHRGPRFFSGSWGLSPGDYYIRDVRHPNIVEWQVDVEELGHETGVLRPWEKLMEAEG